MWVFPVKRSRKRSSNDTRAPCGSNSTFSHSAFSSVNRRLLRMVVMMDGVMMRFVMNTVMVMTRMVFIATAWIPRTAGLCRRKRSGENDHCECNFQVHVVFSLLFAAYVYEFETN
jgi:hypothetical protein